MFEIILLAFGLKILAFGLKTLAFILKASIFGLKTLAFVLKASIFGLKTLAFTLKILAFGLKTLAFILKASKIISNTAVFSAFFAAEGVFSGGKWSSAGQKRAVGSSKNTGRRVVDPNAGGFFCKYEVGAMKYEVGAMKYEVGAMKYEVAGATQLFVAKAAGASQF